MMTHKLDAAAKRELIKRMFGEEPIHRSANVILELVASGAIKVNGMMENTSRALARMALEYHE